MKSNADELAKRGFITDDYKNQFKNYPIDKLETLLKSENPLERTASATLLGELKSNTSILNLCEALQKEKKLYTKIAITEALANIGVESVPYLVELLGKIGDNQHIEPEKKPFNKKSYPLPRDIIARTITKIGKYALAYLENVLKNGEISQISEAIDAIGFITFYSKDMRSLQTLKECLQKNHTNILIKWKIIRAFQSFPLEEVKNYLQNEKLKINEQYITIEIERSLRQIES
ncbi:MAG: hypothetical protein A2086_09850 [Spirochaetes bacterium GWD1_27_9]|nr:MAG: hypothetical protein A2Z98_08615 [Spirochaetes bacterium GWB1_27_13]OHD26496.1 MAG: hypothetical protein A2Y34_12850 [Spirochaetes bacterium GWC1_27_15]OHD42038.1 MAG: hypothetical protein A2086_09850 [Spirochaetes bacterium GWD1_27_9]